MFSPHQQRMRYLVEFTLPDKDSKEEACDNVDSVMCEPREGVEGVENANETPEEGTYNLAS